MQSYEYTNSGSEQNGTNAIAGPLTCTESSRVWYLKLEVNICFCSSLKDKKSFLSFCNETSSGLQK